MKKHCFGRLYSQFAKECQLCCKAIECSASRKAKKKSDAKSIAVYQIIHRLGSASFKQLEPLVFQRFGKTVNVYYYLTALRDEGLVDMRIEGRQRVYFCR